MIAVCRVYSIGTSSCGKAVKMKNMGPTLGLRNLGCCIDFMMPSQAKPEQGKGNFTKTLQTALGDDCNDLFLNSAQASLLSYCSSVYLKLNYQHHLLLQQMFIQYLLWAMHHAKHLININQGGSRLLLFTGFLTHF